MKNKLLIVMIAALIAGCDGKAEYATALKDPITLNLVKQSIGDSMYQPLSYAPDPEYVHNYYNSCSSFSRLKTSFVLIWHPSTTETYRKISCDALDLRLNNKDIAVSASSLIAYYMNEQTEKQEKADNQRIKDEAAAQQTQIENMANGK